jgi:hypothetical protein
MCEMKWRISGRPGQPLLGIHPQVQDRHAVDQRGTHGSHQRTILHAVAGRDHPGPRRQGVFPKPPLQQQRIKGLLHVRRTGRQFVKKQAKRFRLLRQQHARRTEHRAFADDARDAADILRRNLCAEQRAAWQPDLRRRLKDHLRFADAGRRQEQKALLMCHALNQLARLIQRDGFFEIGAGGVHQRSPGQEERPDSPPGSTRCRKARPRRQRRKYFFASGRTARHKRAHAASTPSPAQVLFPPVRA